VDKKSKLKWVGAAVVALIGLTAGRAQALTGTSSYLEIDVSISQTLSVNVNATTSFGVSTYTITWAGTPTIAAGSTVTVTNDSGYFAEMWKLSTYATSLDANTGATGWTINNTPGIEQVEVQATFGAPVGQSNGCTATDWTNPAVGYEPALSTTLQTYTNAVFNETTNLTGIGPDNLSTNRMNAGSSRELCWRMTMPTSTGLTHNQIVPIVVTAF
jgi:hypothetical protein